MKRKIYCALEAFVALMTPVAWMIMMVTMSEDRFSLAGLENMKFFTILSNLLSGLASLICAVYILRKKELPAWLTRLRFAAVSAVAVTFFTVLLFLGPVFGFATMYTHANLWFHLVLPLCSMIAWAIAPIKRLPLKAVLWCFAPVVAYAAVYCANIAINGVGEWPDTNDWYGFFNWGFVPALGIFATMLAVDFGFAAALRMTNGK